MHLCGCGNNGLTTSIRAIRWRLARAYNAVSRFDSDAYRTLLKDYLRAKYASRKIDVAVAVFGPALEFLLKDGDAIFPGTPIVFCGVDKEVLGDRSLPPHVRGVLLKREFAPTLELALKLHPDTKQVVVVAGTSEFDTRLLDWARQQFKAYEARLPFTYLTTLPLQKLLTELAGLPPQTFVLFTTLFRDGAGEPYVPRASNSRRKIDVPEMAALSRVNEKSGESRRKLQIIFKVAANLSSRRHTHAT